MPPVVAAMTAIPRRAAHRPEHARRSGEVEGLSVPSWCIRGMKRTIGFGSFRVFVSGCRKGRVGR